MVCTSTGAGRWPRGQRGRAREYQEGGGGGGQDGGGVGPAKTRYAKQAANLNGPAQNEWPHLVLRSPISFLILSSCARSTLVRHVSGSDSEHPHRYARVTGREKGKEKGNTVEGVVGGRDAGDGTERTKRAISRARKKSKSDTDRDIQRER